MGAQKRRYKRSWKNLLLNKGYQLRFTLFMVALSALLMCGLGFWVMSEARKTTTVSINNVRGEACPKPPAVMSLGGRGDVLVDDLTDVRLALPDVDEAAADEPAAATGSPTAARPAGAEGPAPATRERAKPVVTLDASRMDMVPLLPAGQAVPPEFVDQVIKAYECRMGQAARIESLRQGERHILYVLVAVGGLLVFGLFGYGIKMTHRVAGPLYKVTLYFDKMRDEVYDQIYDLRKGDQLNEFYEHFKAAHSGLRQLQVEDIERLRAAIEVAEAEGLAERSPELAAAITDLRQMLKRKEDSLV